ncbi:MAG TPA: hypothetical protein VIX41_13325, partial [Acidimicrobiales bacterium]
MAHLILGAIGLTWTSFAAAHGRGVVLAGLVTALITPIAVVADRASLSPAVTLAAACALGALLLPVLRRHRSALLGPDMAWLVARLRAKDVPAEQPAEQPAVEVPT